MRWSTCAVVFVSLFCMLMHHAEGDDDDSAIVSFVSSMKDSFSTLSSKREKWFENFSSLKQISDGNRGKISELLLVSQLAIPLIWHLYSTEIKLQKKQAPKLVEEKVDHFLPYFKSFPAQFPFFHVEMTLQLQEESDFQIGITKDDVRKIYLLHVDYDDRRIVFSDEDQEGEINERLVVEGDQFPAISPQQPFRVNIQVADDCIFTSFWVGDLTMTIPSPLPKKYSWCTKEYYSANSFTVNVKNKAEDPDSSQEQASEEEEEETAQKDVKLMSITVYKGILIQ